MLGGDNGLRGYPARYAGGYKLFAATLEDRIFTGFQFMGIEYGGVVFINIGLLDQIKYNFFVLFKKDFRFCIK